MNARIQSICLWSGYAFFLLYLLGIVVVAGFIPPPAPGWSGDAVAAFFGERRGRILVGMSICAFASALYVPWGVAILGEMLRMEKARFAPLSAVQVISAGLGAAFFAISPLMWLALAFRAEHAFFHDGPFAWNGVFGIYLPLAMFALWFQVVTFYLWRGIKDRASTEDAAALQDQAVPASA